MDRKVSLGLVCISFILMTLSIGFASAKPKPMVWHSYDYIDESVDGGDFGNFHWYSPLQIHMDLTYCVMGGAASDVCVTIAKSGHTYWNQYMQAGEHTGTYSPDGETTWIVFSASSWYDTVHYHATVDYWWN